MNKINKINAFEQIEMYETAALRTTAPEVQHYYEGCSDGAEAILARFGLLSEYHAWKNKRP